MRLKKRLIFLSLTEISSIDDNGIYTDLLREFVRDDWNLSIFYGTTQKESTIQRINNVQLIPVFIGKYEKTNIFQKGLSLLAFDKAYLNTIIDNEFESVDLVLYATPPINLTRTISWIKRAYSCKSYLLLKDIFPQNAVDIGLFSRMSPLYHYFRIKEKKLYKISDIIGCMSPENKRYISQHNPEFSHKLEINPNSVDLTRIVQNPSFDKNVLKKYGIPSDKKIVIYGGNLGLPQGIPFLLEFINHTIQQREDVIFVIAGRGTQDYLIKGSSLDNLFYVGHLSVKEFNELVLLSKVGLIALDNRFTIPNFPSRLLSYLSNSLPVLCLVDNVTDIGKIAEKNEFGRCAMNGNHDECYKALVDLIDNPELDSMGKNALSFLVSNYGTDISFQTIIKHLE